MKATIPSKRGCGYEYEMPDPLHIARPGSNHTYAKQLEKDGYTWFSNLDKRGESSNTVICASENDGSLSWIADNAHATNDLLEELENIRNYGGRNISYISAEAVRCITEMAT